MLNKFLLPTYRTDSQSCLQPVYNKDDFFDTLSCNNPGNDAQNGRRLRYFEQVKLDTEVCYMNWLICSF